MQLSSSPYKRQTNISESGAIYELSNCLSQKFQAGSSKQEFFWWKWSWVSSFNFLPFLKSAKSESVLTIEWRDIYTILNQCSFEFCTSYLRNDHIDCVCLHSRNKHKKYNKFIFFFLNVVYIIVYPSSYDVTSRHKENPYQSDSRKKYIYNVSNIFTSHVKLFLDLWACRMHFFQFLISNHLVGK